MKKKATNRLKKTKVQKKGRKTNKKIVITALIALAFIVLAFWNWWFIIPAVILWWMNKKAIKKHFGG